MSGLGNLLARLHLERLEACRLAGRRPPAPAPTPTGAQDDDTAGPSVFVVLAEFDPAEFLAGVLEFAVGLDPHAGRTWLAAYTRTVFLFGNPQNLRERFTFPTVRCDGAIAWTPPAPPSRVVGLRRLLRGVTPSAVPALRGSVTVRVPGPLPPHPEVEPQAQALPRRFDLRVPADVGLSQFLVDAHHTLAEAVLTGVLRHGDEVTVSPVAELALASPVPEQPSYARVLPSRSTDGFELRTWLTRRAA